LIVGLGVALLTLFGSLASAHAQYGAPPPYYPPPPQRGIYRQGFVFGVAGGLGAITGANCLDCGGGAGGLGAHAGGMINPRLAILGEGWFLARPIGDGYSFTQTIFAAALQYWATHNFWLKGGLGGGYTYVNDDYTGLDYDVETALAAQGALGVEVVQSYNFALDLQLRVAHVFHDLGGTTNIAGMVGFNWY
jgi:hypothetical protein